MLMNKASFASITYSGKIQLLWIRIMASFKIPFSFFCSGPQFGDIVMDQCQTDDKLGIDIKDEVGEKCEVHGKKPSKFFFSQKLSTQFKLIIMF